jgi:hypothetical protein
MRRVRSATVRSLGGGCKERRMTAVQGWRARGEGVPAVGSELRGWNVGGTGESITNGLREVCGWGERDLRID